VHVYMMTHVLSHPNHPMHVRVVSHVRHSRSIRISSDDDKS